MQSMTALPTTPPLPPKSEPESPQPPEPESPQQLKPDQRIIKLACGHLFEKEYLDSDVGKQMKAGLLQEGPLSRVLPHCPVCLVPNLYITKRYRAHFCKCETLLKSCQASLEKKFVKLKTDQLSAISFPVINTEHSLKLKSVQAELKEFQKSNPNIYEISLPIMKEMLTVHQRIYSLIVRLQSSIYFAPISQRFEAVC